MKKEDLRIIFFGTPDFAVASLDAIVKEGYKVIAVVTAPDKPAGRGKIVTGSEVKEYAKRYGLTVLQPERLKDPDFLSTLHALKPNIGVVVAFRMLPEVVWAIPELGTFNLHASLLPQYRGATPINHVLINGEHETGVTTFFLSHEIDTGKILFQKKTQIGFGTNAGQLHDQLMIMGAELVIETLQAIETGNFKLTSQDLLIKDDEVLKSAPKIHREYCRICWDKKAVDIYNFIRGLSPYPTAFSILKSSDGPEYPLKIYNAFFENISHDNQIGRIYTNQKDTLAVWVKDGRVCIKEVQYPGKKRMSVKDFLNGYKIPGGSQMF
jgi:methionyl-tRNA formyltransferase